MAFWVKVPVLSKQNVLTFDASVAFYGSVPNMLCFFKRAKESE